MLADDQMDVIEQDGARVAGVVELLDRFRESDGTAFDRGTAEIEQRMCQTCLCLRVESTDMARCGLDFPATVVEFTEFFQCVDADCFGAASARVVGEPPAVKGPDDMV